MAKTDRRGRQPRVANVEKEYLAAVQGFFEPQANPPTVHRDRRFKKVAILTQTWLAGSPITLNSDMTIRVARNPGRDDEPAPEATAFDYPPSIHWTPTPEFGSPAEEGTQLDPPPIIEERSPSFEATPETPAPAPSATTRQARHTRESPTSAVSSTPLVAANVQDFPPRPYREVRKNKEQKTTTAARARAIQGTRDIQAYFAKRSRDPDDDDGRPAEDDERPSQRE